MASLGNYYNGYYNDPHQEWQRQMALQKMYSPQPDTMLRQMEETMKKEAAELKAKEDAKHKQLLL